MLGLADNHNEINKISEKYIFHGLFNWHRTCIGTAQQSSVKWENDMHLLMYYSKLRISKFLEIAKKKKKNSNPLETALYGFLRAQKGSKKAPLQGAPLSKKTSEAEPFFYGFQDKMQYSFNLCCSCGVLVMAPVRSLGSMVMMMMMMVTLNCAHNTTQNCLQNHSHEPTQDPTKNHIQNPWQTQVQHRITCQLIVFLNVCGIVMLMCWHLGCRIAWTAVMNVQMH